MRRATLWCLASLAFVIFASIATPAEPKGGAVEQSVTVDGISRKYLVFARKGFEKPLPVVLALHGGGSNARQMERYTRFSDLAAKEGFLVVYPEAVDGNWNDGRGIEGVRAQQENIDDVKFVRLIVDRIGCNYWVGVTQLSVFCRRAVGLPASRGSSRRHSTRH
jgi:polyhydroxybutyrate depolymerase